jgi:putative ABC transport system ATP-binding protein
MLELVGAVKHYRQGSRVIEAVRGVDMRVEPGEFVGIMGPSGSGKSSLMHLMGGLDTPTAGKALFEGRDLSSMSDAERTILRRTRLGVIFQFFNLLPTLTAEENVALPLLLRGERRLQAIKAANQVLERVNLGKRGRHLPEEMSGGEMQRVAIARALVLKPAAVLCDEPTGNLDSENTAQVLDLLGDLPRSERCAVVMVTHDASAGARTDRLVRIRDGKIAGEDYPCQAAAKG